MLWRAALRRGVVLLLTIAMLLAGSGAAYADLAVAAASDLQNVLPDIARRFEQASGQRVGLTFGSSGNFVAQIQNGAPFDVFLSADTAYVEQLVTSGHAAKATAVEYATGRLVLWARTDRQVDVRRGLTVLGDATVRRVAIANPQHAPYGRAAVAALQHAGLYERVKDRLVLGENIAQAAQFVQSGNADAGLIAMSLALSPALRASGRYFEVPSDAYPAIRQSAVALSRSSQPSVAAAFLSFLTRSDITALLQASGFGAPQ